MERSKTISTKHLTLYRVVSSLFAIIMILLGVLYYLNFGISGWLVTIFACLSIYMNWVQYNFKLKSIEYDKENIYVQDGQQDVQISMADIKSIELDNIGGAFRINFFQQTPFGMNIYFKPSIYYPINFSKMDAKINELRSIIDRAKRQKLPSDNLSQLTSYNG